MRSKEIAKFFSGLTAWEAVVHLALGLSGVLPLLLGYYAWSKK